MDIISHSVSQTRIIGKAIARHLSAGAIVCLYGELGSGKTVLTQGISSGFGIDAKEVISPTFVLLRQYEGSLRVYHFDLYRLNSPGDIAALGYEEYLFDDGVSVIEWADKLRCLLPKEFLKIRLRVLDDTKRALSLSARGSWYKEILKEIHEDIGR